MTYDFNPEVLDYVAPADTLAQMSVKVNTNFSTIAAWGAAVESVSGEGTAGETLGQYKLVYSDVNNSGKFYLATNNETSAKADVVGITLDAISVNATGTIQLGVGIVTNGSWSWTIGSQLFLGTNGDITTSPTSNYWFKPIGFAISATELWFQPMLGWSIGDNGFEVDTDQLEVAYIPTNYTRTITSEVAATTQLSAHLKGIDEKLAEIIAMIPS